MAYNPNKHNRKSIRLKGYDYAKPGFYFVTMVVQNRRRLFGNIKNGILFPNDAGRMIDKWYAELPNKFPTIKCHEKIIMPDHFHCIIEITVGADQTVGADHTVGADQTVGADLRVCPKHTKIPKKGEHIGSPTHGGLPLSTIVQWFKTMSTNEYIRKVKSNNWERFDSKLWQRNYYEHIIRNERSLNRIAEYIRNNPKKWEQTKY